jgi:hypothetical protein
MYRGARRGTRGQTYMWQQRVYKYYFSTTVLVQVQEYCKVAEIITVHVNNNKSFHIVIT